MINSTNNTNDNDDDNEWTSIFHDAIFILLDPFAISKLEGKIISQMELRSRNFFFCLVAADTNNAKRPM